MSRYFSGDCRSSVSSWWHVSWHRTWFWRFFCVGNLSSLVFNTILRSWYVRLAFHCWVFDLWFPSLANLFIAMFHNIVLRIFLSLARVISKVCLTSETLDFRGSDVCFKTHPLVLDVAVFSAVKVLASVSLVSFSVWDSLVLGTFVKVVFCRGPNCSEVRDEGMRISYFRRRIVSPRAPSGVANLLLADSVSASLIMPNEHKCHIFNLVCPSVHAVGIAS